MYTLTLVSPERQIEKNAEFVELSVPAYQGELNILPGHSPLMTTLCPGSLKYKLRSGKETSLFISWGYCQVTDQGVTVLVDESFSYEDLLQQGIEQQISVKEAEIHQEMDVEKVEKLLSELDLLRKKTEFIRQKNN